MGERLGILRHSRPPRQERGILRHGIQRNGRKKLFMRNDNRKWPIHNATPTAWIGSIVEEIWCLEVEFCLVVHGMGTLRHFLKKKIFERDFLKLSMRIVSHRKLMTKKHPRHELSYFLWFAVKHFALAVVVCRAVKYQISHDYSKHLLFRNIFLSKNEIYFIQI